MTDSFNDQPIHTGHITVHLAGDVAGATGYIREARRVIGALRTMYGVNERIADGEPGGFYRTSKTMADGTRIEGFHNNGSDIVKITAPPKGVPTTETTTVELVDPTPVEGVQREFSVSDEFEPPVPEEEARPVTEEEAVEDERHDYPSLGFVAVGDAEFEGPANGADYCLLWRSPTEVDLIPQYAGIFQGSQYLVGISGNGEVAFGAGNVYEREGEGYNDKDFAWYWTKDGGTKLFDIDGADSQCEAREASDDGDIIVGAAYHYTRGGPVAWYWTAASGCQIFHQFTNGTGHPVCCSSNGVYQTCVVDAFNEGGGTSAIYSLGEFICNVDGFITGIADNGDCCGATGFQFGTASYYGGTAFLFTMADREWKALPGTMATAITADSEMVVIGNGIWTEADGLVDLPSPGGSYSDWGASGISQYGDYVIGTVWTRRSYDIGAYTEEWRSPYYHYLYNEAGEIYALVPMVFFDGDNPTAGAIPVEEYTPSDEFHVGALRLSNQLVYGEMDLRNYPANYWAETHAREGYPEGTFENEAPDYVSFEDHQVAAQTIHYTTGQAIIWDAKRNFTLLPSAGEGNSVTGRYVKTPITYGRDLP